MGKLQDVISSITSKALSKAGSSSNARQFEEAPEINALKPAKDTLPTMISSALSKAGKSAAAPIKPQKASMLDKVKDTISSWASDENVKGYAKGAAITGLAAALGGSTGVSAAGNIASSINQRRKERDLDAVRKTKEKLEEERVKTQLDLDRERLTSAKLKNYSDVQSGIFGDAMTGGFGGNVGKVKTGLSGSKKTDSEDNGNLRIPKPEPLTIDPDKAGKGGAELGTDIAINSGLKDAGLPALKKNREAISADLDAMGLSPAQKNAAIRELSEQAARGVYAEQKAIVERGSDLSIQDKLAAFSEKPLGTIAGTIIGTGMGLAFGPWGAMAGGAAGGAIGNAMVTPTIDAIADYANRYSEENYTPLDIDLTTYGDQLAEGLQRAGLYDRMAVMDAVSQLIQMPDIASLPQHRRDKLIQYVLNKFPDSYERQDTGF